MKMESFTKRCRLFFILLLCSCGSQQKVESISEACYRLYPLTQPKHPVQPGEWRATYPEPYESLAAYCAKGPTAATSERSKLYVVQLGTFDDKGLAILAQTKAYLSAFFQIPVAELSAIDIHVIDSVNLRANTFGPQIRTGAILDSLLPSLLPDSAFALIAFSLYDLYPADDWNFVFGQASLKRRVGVWSLSRFGDYNAGEADYRRCLTRTLHVAAHETGHMFGVTHCLQNECCMNGSNSLEEGDGQPQWLCWECMAKICMNRNIMPVKHVTALLAFHQQMSPHDTATAYYQRALQLLKQ